MFLTGSFGGARGGLSGPDPEMERDPPPAPTLATFPSNLSYAEAEWSTAPIPDFHQLFARVCKPADISDKHVMAFNIATLPPASVDDMLPSAAAGASYLPSPAEHALVNEDPMITRQRKDYEERLAELSIENDIAFRTITRNVAQGIRPPRIAHMRKFWEGLENMSQYWDSSLDQYYEIADLKEQEHKASKRQRLEDEDDPNVQQTKPTAERTSPFMAEGSERQLDHETDRDSSTGAGPDESAVESDPILGKTTPAPLVPKLRYKGRRTGTGRDMPDQYRSATVRGFVEGTIWPFRTSLIAPRVMPIVQFGRLVLPVRQNAAVYRIPDERMKARQGWLAGPVLSLQIRPETDFQVADEKETEQKSRLDFVREIGGLLQIAQERHREKKVETKPGEGKWWTTIPRWGGGPGGEVQNEIGNSDVVALAQEVIEDTKDNSGRKDPEPRKDRRRRNPAILWKELKCGKGYWDPRIEYEAIGKDAESEYDEVFLLSSINHHISLVKLTIHGKYIDCLMSGTASSPLPEDPEWCRPKLQRSQWFDLFDKDQRLEAFRGLWSVMMYLTRSQAAQAS